MGRILIVLVALITMGTAANAATLASGAIFGGSTQNNATCYLYNAGNSAVSILSAQIIRQAFGPVPLVANTCGASLAAGAICGIAAFAVNNLGHACKFVVGPDGAAVRGTFELRIGTTTVLQNAELR